MLSKDKCAALAKELYPEVTTLPTGLSGLALQRGTSYP